MVRHFLDLDQIDSSSLRQILTLAKEYKKPKDVLIPKPLSGKVLAMIFEKPSTRTRVSFEVGMLELGGHSTILSNTTSQLGRGETIADTARVLSRYVDAIMIRTDAHQKLEELAEYASVPVINGLTDYSHPCQVMADILTFEEHRGDLEGKKVVWVGDNNNVARSWMHAATHFNFTFCLACPEEMFPALPFLDEIQSKGAKIELFQDPLQAVKEADLVLTDTWISMGFQQDSRREVLLKPYQVNAALMAKTKENALFMHCLPAHRGEEVTNDVIDGRHSVVWDEAENRLHVQKSNSNLVFDTMITDLVYPFQMQNGNFRGRFIRLNETLNTILGKHDYPKAVAKLLAQALLLTVTLANSVKFQGVFTLQIKGDHAVSLLVVDITSEGQLRGYARFDKAKVISVKEDTSLSEIVGQGYLAFTIDQGENTDRYQGIVQLEGNTLAECVESYFKNSEQLATSLKVMVAEKDGLWSGATFMIQRMPQTSDTENTDDWDRLCILMKSATSEEALSDMKGEKLLFRLFHDDDLVVYHPSFLKAECRCSLEKVGSTLQSFPKEELEELKNQQGEIIVTCEFCKTSHIFKED